MKKLDKIRLNNAIVLNNKEMKTVVGGLGSGTVGGETKKVCAYFSCACDNGISPASGSQEASTWQMPCNSSFTAMVSMVSNHCTNGQGGCVKVYREIPG